MHNPRDGARCHLKRTLDQVKRTLGHSGASFAPVDATVRQMNVSVAQGDATLHHLFECPIQKDASPVQRKTTRYQEATALDQEGVTLGQWGLTPGQ